MEARVGNEVYDHMRRPLDLVDRHRPGATRRSCTSGRRAASGASPRSPAVPSRSTRASRPSACGRPPDGGATWNLVWDGNASARGVNQVALDPADPSIVYASAFQQGIWRCTSGCNANGDFTRIYSPVAPTQNTDRAQFALTRTGAHTRMYVGDGSVGRPASVALLPLRRRRWSAGSSTFLSLSSSNPGGPGASARGTSAPASAGTTTRSTSTRAIPTRSGCSAPTGTPSSRNTACARRAPLDGRRRVVLRRDRGLELPGELDPPGRARVAFDPNNPNIIFQGSDGGVIRTDGAYSDISARCAARGLTGAVLARCQQLLSRAADHRSASTGACRRCSSRASCSTRAGLTRA